MPITAAQYYFAEHETEYLPDILARSKITGSRIGVVDTVNGNGNAGKTCTCTVNEHRGLVHKAMPTTG